MSELNSCKRWKSGEMRNGSPDRNNSGLKVAQKPSKSERRVSAWSPPGWSGSTEMSRRRPDEQDLTRTCRCDNRGGFSVGNAAGRGTLLRLCGRRRRCGRSCCRSCRGQCHCQLIRAYLRGAAGLFGLPRICSCSACRVPGRILGAPTRSIRCLRQSRPLGPTAILLSISASRDSSNTARRATTCRAISFLFRSCQRSPGVVARAK